MRARERQLFKIDLKITAGNIKILEISLLPLHATFIYIPLGVRLGKNSFPASPIAKSNSLLGLTTRPFPKNSKKHEKVLTLDSWIMSATSA